MTQRHMRALRTYRYRCQYRDDRGLRCLNPASRTRLIDGTLAPVCEDHA